VACPIHRAGTKAVAVLVLVPNRVEADMDVALLAKASISLRLSIPGILALIAGVLILLFPRLLNYLVALYLIVVGLVLVFNLHL
jgi:hypothetical protein